MRIQNVDRTHLAGVFDRFWTEPRTTGFLGAFPFTEEISFRFIAYTGVALVVGSVGVPVYAHRAISQVPRTFHHDEDAGTPPATLSVADTGVATVVSDLCVSFYARGADVFAASPALIGTTVAHVAVVIGLF